MLKWYYKFLVQEAQKLFRKEFSLVIHYFQACISDIMVSVLFDCMAIYLRMYCLLDGRGAPDLEGWLIFWKNTENIIFVTLVTGKYVGNRPIKLRKSNWRERTDNEALERQKVHLHLSIAWPLFHSLALCLLTCCSLFIVILVCSCLIFWFSLGRTTLKRNQSFLRRVCCTSDPRSDWR